MGGHHNKNKAVILQRDVHAESPCKRFVRHDVTECPALGAMAVKKQFTSTKRSCMHFPRAAINTVFAPHKLRVCRTRWSITGRANN